MENRNFFLGKIDISRKCPVQYSSVLLFIQPHFDYARPAWYPNLNETKNKKKIQIVQNKCICFCPKLNKMLHISEEEFKLT